MQDHAGGLQLIADSYTQEDLEGQLRLKVKLIPAFLFHSTDSRQPYI